MTADPDTAHAALEPLARNRDFKVVLVGQGVSSFGDAITNTALPLLVLALTGSGFAMGIVGALSTLPDLLVGLPAGAYADRWDRRRMMFVADLGRAVITVAVPLTYWLGGPTMAVILLITFPLNVLRVLWLAAYTAAVPGLVGRPQIARANAIFETFFNVGWIAGPALAGVLSAVFGPASAIAIDAVTFVVSSAALLLVRRPLRPAPRAERPHLLSDIREGVRYVAGHATLRAVVLFWASSQVVTAALATALTYYVTRDRGLPADVLGIILSAFGVGLPVLPGRDRQQRRQPRRRLLPACCSDLNSFINPPVQPCSGPGNIQTDFVKIHRSRSSFPDAIERQESNGLRFSPATDSITPSGAQAIISNPSPGCEIDW